MKNIMRNYIQKMYSIVGDTSKKVAIYEDAICSPTIFMDANIHQIEGGLYSSKKELIVNLGRYKKSINKELRANPKQNLIVKENLPGISLYGGLIHNHFGHFLTESLSRLWVTNIIEKVDYIVFIKQLNTEIPSFIYDFFEMLGLKSKIRFIEQPTTLDKVFVARQSLEYPNLFHDFFLGLRDNLHKKLTIKSNTNNQPLYISRAALIPGYARIVIGETIIEKTLKSYGFRVFNPEVHSLEEQFKVFNEHKNIVGYAGSAFHNLLFTKGDKNILYYSARKVPSLYKKIDKSLGNSTRYIRSKYKNNLSLLYLKTGFKPEIVNPYEIVSEVLSFKDFNINTSIHKVHDNLAMDKLTIVTEYNTALVLRYIVEQLSQENLEIENIFQTLKQKIDLDDQLMTKAINASPELKSFFEGNYLSSNAEQI